MPSGFCADHADLIDKDEVTYTIEDLKKMKREHEATQAMLLRIGAARDLGLGLFAIGPEVVCLGDVESFTESSWTIQLKNYIRGDLHQLVSFISAFSGMPDLDRYVLSTELGDGRLLAAAPILSKANGTYRLSCVVEPAAERISVKDIGSSYAMHPVTNDMYVDEKGHIARVSGLDYFPQKLCSCLSMQRRESVFSPDYGVRFFEYSEEFQGSPWLSTLLMLDVVRMTSIPYQDEVQKREYTPLLCVTRVRMFQLLSEIPTDH